MEHASPEEIKKHLRRAIMVFVILLVLTALTVVASRLDLGHSGNIVVALLIAVVKGSLVGAYFMHLISEKTLIYAVLITGALFFFLMMGIPLFQNFDPISR